MTTILLIQLFQEPPFGISALEMSLSKEIGSQLVAIDNFSEGSNVAYVRQLIEQNDQIITIVWEHEGGNAKGVQPIFNALLKKKRNVTLLTNVDQGVVARMAKALKAQVVKDETSLTKVIKTASNPPL